MILSLAGAIKKDKLFSNNQLFLAAQRVLRDIKMITKINGLFQINLKFFFKD